MSGNFLHSSPSSHEKDSKHLVKDQDIDPALYTESPEIDRKKTRLSNQMTPSNFTGWTPLISKTVNNEQLLNYNSTPSSRYINNILLNSASHNSILPQNDIDYSNGLNLTPFLNHNINLLNSNQFNAANNPTSGTVASFTPFHDKALYLSDFFIDSPTKNATPAKDLETITPSKFKLGSDKKPKQLLFQDPKSAKKRSVHELDTPYRQPHKLSISVKANDLTDDELDDENTHKKPPMNFQTPSKVVVLGDRTNRATDKTPLRQNQKEFVTPAKPTQNSSPSTVILSSTKRSPAQNARKFVPNSPTPMSSNNSKFSVKVDEENQTLPPVMGIFSDAKLKNKSLKKLSSKPREKDANPNKSTTRFGTDILVNNMRFKTNNKARMQAGMNKFQIVLGNGSGSKRGRKGKKDKEREREKEKERELKKSKKEVTVETQAHADSVKLPKKVMMPVSQENTSVNKDSSLMSGSNNSMNLSNLNISQGTEHTSFDFSALSSTPNGKYFLDKMFEKPSPQSQQLLNQVLMSQQYTQPQPSGNMPPPKVNIPNHQTLHSHNTQVMMMSTPNHTNIYTSHDIPADQGHKNQDNSNDEANVSLSAFSYPFERKGQSPRFPNGQHMLPIGINNQNTTDNGKGIV